MASVVFSTPGLIPIEAFTVFGMNAKPNSTNPFGFFGTGLKIAIAVCIRMGQEVVIWRGKDKYTFYTSKTNFRGKEFGKIRMKKEMSKIEHAARIAVGKATYHDLPFTTELGKHWELWQAFREFQTNTMDEDGETYINSHQDGYIARGNDNNSFIVVTGQKFLDEYYDRDRNFLPEGLTQRSDSSGEIQVLDRPSRHVYYRGVRVMDLKQESRYTYNFLKYIELTEDRTAKYPFLLESDICDLILSSEDNTFVSRTAGSGSHDSWESGLSYSYAYATPSKTFVAVAKNSPNPISRSKAVEADRPITPSTRITVIVPKSEVTEAELGLLTNAVGTIFGDVVVEMQGDR